MILTSLVRANKTQTLVASMKARARMPGRVAGELRGHSHSNPEITKVVPPPPDGRSLGATSFGESVALTRADSAGFRTPVPIQSVHPFRSIPNSVPGFSYTLEMGGLTR